MGSQLETFSWDYCVADKDSTANNTGYVTALIAEEHLHGGKASVYLCGPPPMVEAVRTHFSDNGLVPFGFYFEKFALSGTAASAPAKASDPTRTIRPPHPMRVVDNADNVEGVTPVRSPTPRRPRLRTPTPRQGPQPRAGARPAPAS